MTTIREGDPVTVVKRYAACQGKSGLVLRTWTDPNGNKWARVSFGRTLDGSPLRQVIPHNCLGTAKETEQ